MKTWRQDAVEGKGENEMSDPTNCAEMSRRGGRKSVIPHCQRDNFLNSGPPPLTQTRKRSLPTSNPISRKCQSLSHRVGFW